MKKLEIIKKKFEIELFSEKIKKLYKINNYDSNLRTS